MNNLYSVTRSLFLSALFLISFQAIGQQSVSIGTTEIKSNAVLYLLGSGSQGLIIPVTANPSSITPAAGMVVFNSSDQKVYFCDGTNWAPIDGGVGATDSQTLTISGNTISISNGNSQNIAGTAPTMVGQILTWDGTKWTSSSGANAPAINQVLQWNGTSWVPSTLASGGSVTSVATGTGLTGGPITTSGTIALANTAVTPGSYGSATAIPQLTIDAQGRITAAANLNILNANTTTTGLLSSADWNTFNNKLSTIPTLGGDISGTLGAVTVDRIKNIAVSGNAPTTGQVLQYNGTQWAPTTLALGGTVTTVTGTAPISVSNNTTTPIVSISQAGSTTNGYLSSTDWVSFNSKLTNPMTTAGDIIYGGVSGAPTRLATGTGFLKGGATPSYSAVNLASADVSGTLALANGGTGATTASGARTNLGLGTLATLSNISTAEITDGTIVAADLSSMGATNGQILKYNGAAWVAAADDVGGGATPTLANGQILIGNGTTNSAAALSGDATLSAGVITIGTGVITSAKIADGTIAAADLSSMGATSGQVMQYNGTAWVPATGSGLSSTLNNGNIFVGNGSNVATGVAMSGDATISNTGALTLANSASTRTNLGLGSLATLSTVTTTEITNGTIAAIDLANSSVSGGAGGVITDASITAADLAVGAVDLATTDVTGILALANGGTGSTTAAGARTNLGLGTLATASTITSAEITDATITGADLAAGSVDLSTTDVTGTLPLANGGTGSTTAAGARTSLGLGTLATLSAVSTTEITDGTIAAADLSSMSATNGQILKYNGTAWVAAADDVGGGATPTLANGQILIGNGTTNSAAALSGDATLSAGVITIGTGAITSAKILDGTIAATDLSSMGATNGQVMQYNGTAWVPASGTGLSSTLNNGNIFVGNATNVATGVAMSGDATISNTGALTLANSTATRTNLGLGSLATLSTVTTTEITNGTIAAVDLANSSVSGGAGGVITDASITAADLAVGSVDLTTTDVTGTLPLTLGGTGATTAAAARTSLGLGTLATASSVTSTEITDGTITGSDLGTGAVDLASTDVTGTLPITLGGTGATTAIAARTNLGLGTLATLNTVGTTEITDASVTNAKISSVGLGKLLQGGATTGQVLKWDGALWSPATDDVGGGATPTLSNGQILIGNGTTNSAAALSGDATLNAGVLTLSSGAVGSPEITDASIAAADLAAGSVSGGLGGVIADGTINAADLSTMSATNGQVLQFNGTAWAPATIAGGVTTLDGLTDVTVTTPSGGQILVNNGGGQFANVAMSGDGSITAAGALTLTNSSATRTNLGLGTLATLSAVGSTEITNGSIAAADLATGSVDFASTTVTGIVAIANGGTGANTASGALTNLGALSTSLTAGNIWIGNGTNVATPRVMSGDATITNAGVITVGTGAITSAKILDGTIAAADLATMGATPGQVLTYNGTAWAPAATISSTLTSGNIYVGNSGNVATSVAMSGDATLSNTGVLTIADGSITNQKVASVGLGKLLQGGASSGDVLKWDGAAWSAAADAGFANPMTTSGDMIVGGVGGQAARLASPGASRAILGYNGSSQTWITGGTNQIMGTDGAGNLTFLNQSNFASTALPSAQILVGSSGNIATAVAMSGDATISNTGALTLAAGSVSGGAAGDITDATITAADLAVGAVDLATTDVTGTLPITLGGTGATTAAAARTNLGVLSSALTSTNIYVGNNLNTATAVAMSGDATLSNTGVLTIAANAIGSGEITDGSIAAADLAGTAVTASNGLTATTNNVTLGGTLTANTTINLSTFDLALNGTGGLAVGTTTAASKLDVEGGVAIGSTYAGTTAAPTNGLIVEGIMGIGTSAPTASSGVTLNLPLAATIKDGLVITNNYNSTGTKAGLVSTVSPDGSGTRYGLNTVAYSGTTGALYGIANTISHTGSSGTLYGTNQSIANASTNASVVYGDYTTITNSGGGNTFGTRIDVNKPASTAGEVYGLSIEASNNGTANSYLMYGNSNGTTSGTEYGLWLTGEDLNYFSGSLGIGTSAAGAKIDVQNSALSKVFNATLTASGGLGQVFNFERTQVPSSGNDLFQLVVPSGSPTGFQFLEAQVGTNVVFRIDGNGSAYSDGTFNPGGADYAELVEVSQNSTKLEAGDVIVIDVENGKMAKATSPRSTLVAGIFSTKPGIIGSEKSWASGVGSDDEGGQYVSVEDRISSGEVPLAMLGIVPCKVSAENGPIKPGDLLVTSGTPGYAMKDENPKAGTIVGKALEGLESGKGVIKVMVTLQ